jgi:hypothetical protein
VKKNLLIVVSLLLNAQESSAKEAPKQQFSQHDESEIAPMTQQRREQIRERQERIREEYRERARRALEAFQRHELVAPELNLEPHPSSAH